jgi:predicted MFS family arabinose efflux permease
VTLTLAGVAFLALSIAPTLPIGVVAFVVAVSARNTMTPLFNPLLLDSLPVSQHNIVSSLGSVVWSLGWFLATGSSGFVQERLGFGFMFQVVALGVFLTGMMIVSIFRSRRPLHETTAA